MAVGQGYAFSGVILILAALLTWGVLELAQRADDDNGDSSSNSTPDADSDIQALLNDANPGDFIDIPEGVYYISLTTAVGGTASDPITIRGAPGTDRENVVIKGEDDEARIIEILHSYYVIEDFTVDGEIEAGAEYREQLIFIEGSEDPSDLDGFQSSLDGTVIRNMELKNSGKECVRLRYFVTNTVITGNDIRNCGVTDFVVEQSGSNGEGIYIGTAEDQWSDKNGDNVPDVCAGNWVTGNYIETQGGEGVDVKEGSEFNVVEYNEIYGEIDAASAGIGIRGNENVIRYNTVVDAIGSCIRLGGEEVEGTQYGVNNEVYGNDLIGCLDSGIKVVVGPQIICENEMTPPDDADDTYQEVRGEASADYLDAGEGCPSGLMDVTIPPTPTPSSESSAFDDSSFANDDVVEEGTSHGDDNTGGDDKVYTDDGSPVTTSGYEYVGCFKDDEDARILSKVTEDETSMTIETCVDACYEAARDYAGLQYGIECWCGSPEEYDTYGTGLCNYDCSGDSKTTCGGYVAFSLFRVYSGGNANDDGGGSGSDVDDSGTEVVVAADDDGQGDDATGRDGGSGSDTDRGVTTTSLSDSGIATDSTGDDAVVGTTADYVGCYKVLSTDTILSDGYTSDSMTPASCVSYCEGEVQELAGLKNGNECWCGTTDDYSKYGSGSCSSDCAGDFGTSCGGTDAMSFWRV